MGPAQSTERRVAGGIVHGQPGVACPLPRGAVTLGQYVEMHDPDGIPGLKLPYAAEMCYNRPDSGIKWQNRSASAFPQLCFLALDSHATLPVMRRSHTQGALHEHLCRQPFV